MLARPGQVRTESVRLCDVMCWLGELGELVEPPVQSCCRLTGLVLLSQWRTGEPHPSQHGLPWSILRSLQGVCHEGNQGRLQLFNIISSVTDRPHSLGLYSSYYVYCCVLCVDVHLIELFTSKFGLQNFLYSTTFLKQ